MYDGIDQNCDGLNDYDQDGDGFDSSLHGGDDCDDTDVSLGSNTLDTNCDGISDTEICDDGIDNDNNGLIDCEDSGCFTFSTCFEDCSDGTDNDGDFLTDCDDDDCWGTGSCTTGYTIIQGSGEYADGDNNGPYGPWSQPSGTFSSSYVSVNDFEGVLRVPTGPNSFEQCSWTVEHVLHEWQYRSWTTSTLTVSSNINWNVQVDNIDADIALQRTNFILNPACAHQRSIQSMFLGTDMQLNNSGQAEIWNPVLNQWIEWYAPLFTLLTFNPYNAGLTDSFRTGLVLPDYKVDVPLSCMMMMRMAFESQTVMIRILLLVRQM